VDTEEKFEIVHWKSFYFIQQNLTGFRGTKIK